MPVGDFEMRVIDFLDMNLIPFAGGLTKGIDIRISRLIDHVLLIDHPLPVVLFPQGQPDRFACHFIQHNLISAGLIHSLAHQSDRDLLWTDVIVVVIVVPGLLHLNDFRHNADTGIVIPDHGEKAEIAPVIRGLAADQTRIVIRMHIVLMVHGRDPVDIRTAGCRAIRVLMRIGTLGMPLVLISVVIRSHHVQIGSSLLETSELKGSTIRPLAQVQGNG